MYYNTMTQKKISNFEEELAKFQNCGEEKLILSWFYLGDFEWWPVEKTRGFLPFLGDSWIKSGE